MPFDVFNGSLLDDCLVYVAGLELVTYSHIQGTRRAKSPNNCALVVTSLTGDRHRSDRCRPSEVVGWVTVDTSYPIYL
jgi:homoserine acetyltransferase